VAQAAKSVFIVDDDESVRASLRLLVESAGHRAVTFASAEEFLQSGFMKDADCLILDIRMPGMGGFELQECLATSEPRIPVIFVTGHDRLGMEENAMKLGAIAYLRKPFDGQSLLDAIQRASTHEVYKTIDARCTCTTGGGKT
jgi:two-component system, LuxR family, response regulator FixJ